MASTTLTVQTPAITGLTIVSVTDVGSSETVTFGASTAQGSIDMATCFIRCKNADTAGGLTLSIGAGGEYQATGIGAASVTIASETTVIIGGQLFESSRFLTSSGTIIITQAGTGPSTWEAFQAPRASQ